ncbi:MAG: hypothetical protein GKS05_00295 [Nitrospirales bacterium]|nr:hypothetical protein [Nitrospirales bacterium]NKB80339.1 hypothetical protein [Nitrospirales bacterium]
MAPDLPKNLIERPREFNQLLNFLLGEDKEEPITITTSFRGAGGLGKTTLASAICHHDDIITAYDDGILWVTLGQRPQIREELTKLYAALTGQRPGFIDEEDVTIHLAQKLEDLNCLIVIDDVWDLTHLRPFLRIGKHSARLITTRNFSVAAETKSVNVNEMTNPEAVEMLTNRLTSGNENVQLFQHLARRLGEWPLLLELAGAALRHRLERGDTIRGAVSYLNRKLDKQGVSAFDQWNPQERHQAITRTIEVSLDHFKEAERMRYFELAIFPEDEQIPLKEISMLWGLDDFEVEELIQQFDNFSLLVFNLRTSMCRVHDVMRAYMAGQIIDSPALHGRLLNSWGDPLRLSSNYAWHWFSYHLVKAERQLELRNLLLDFHWLQAKLEATNINSLLRDFLLVPNDHKLRVVASTLQLSAHVLAEDKKQLARQLLGRLHDDHSPEITMLREKAMSWRSAPWLIPLEPNLTPPGGTLILTLKGHHGRIRCLAMVPQSSLVISGSDDCTLKLWDPKQGKEVRTFAGHKDWVRAVAVSFNGQQAVSISDDRTLRIWNLANSELEKTIYHNVDRPLALAVTPDGQYAISATDDHSLRVWDLKNGVIQRTLLGHLAKINVLQVTSCGNWLISASDDRTIKVWNLKDGTERYDLKGHTHRVNALSIMPDNQNLVFASSDDTLRLWDFQKGIFLKVLRKAIGVKGLGATPDGKYVLASCEDNKIQMWSVRECTLRQTFIGHNACVNSVALSSDGTFAVSASDDHTLRVWDLTEETNTFPFKGHFERVRAIVVSPDGKRAVSTSDDRTMRFWELDNRTQTHAPIERNHWPIAFTSDGKNILSSAGDATIALINLDAMLPTKIFFGHTDRIRALASTDDGKYLISASDDRTIKIWDLEKVKLKMTIPIQGRYWVRALAVTPNSQFIVSAVDSQTIKVWSFEKGTEYQSISGLTARQNSLAIFPSGQRFISGSDDCTVKVWTVGCESSDLILKGHIARVNDVDVLSEKYVISCSHDHM